MAAISATLKVSVDDVRRSSNNFGRLASDTRNLTNNMTRIVDGTRHVWQGEAQTAYWRKFDGLRDDMQRIFKKIDEYRTDLNEIARNYEAAENANKSAAGALNSDVIR